MIKVIRSYGSVIASPTTETALKAVSKKRRRKFRQPKVLITKEQRQAFFTSIEWQEMRRFVFVAYGRRCMCCGTGSNLEIDHIYPISKYPKLCLTFNNLQVLCAVCNSVKSNFRKWRFAKPDKIDRPNPERLKELRVIGEGYFK